MKSYPLREEFGSSTESILSNPRTPYSLPCIADSDSEHAGRTQLCGFEADGLNRAGYPSIVLLIGEVGPKKR